MNQKAQNLLFALQKAGYDGHLLRGPSRLVDGKFEHAFHFILFSQSRNAFHPGEDIRIQLDGEDVSTIAAIAKKRGFLTFLDQDFHWADNADDFQTPGYHEWGFVFYPSHIIGRLKRVVSSTRKAVVELAPFLKQDATYVKFWEDLDLDQDKLLHATKYATVDLDGDLRVDGFTNMQMAIVGIQNDIGDFHRGIGTAFTSRTTWNTHQLQAMDVVAHLDHLSDNGCFF